VESYLDKIIHNENGFFWGLVYMHFSGVVAVINVEDMQQYIK